MIEFLVFYHRNDQQRLLLAIEPIDFRKGICGLKTLCRNHLDENPFSGKVFGLSNHARTSVKLLAYDASSFWLCQKRFSKGKLAWWPSSIKKSKEICTSELAILLVQGNPEQAFIPQVWKKEGHVLV